MSLPPLAGEATRQPPRGVKVTPLLLDPFLQRTLGFRKNLHYIIRLVSTTRVDWRHELQGSRELISKESATGQMAWSQVRETEEP